MVLIEQETTCRGLLNCILGKTGLYSFSCSGWIQNFIASKCRGDAEESPTTLPQLSLHACFIKFTWYVLGRSIKRSSGE